MALVKLYEPVSSTVFVRCEGMEGRGVKVETPEARFRKLDRVSVGGKMILADKRGYLNVPAHCLKALKDHGLLITGA